MESRGNALLGNHKQAPINEFVVSVKPVLHVNQLAVEQATLVQSDAAQGFYLFRLNALLAPGATGFASEMICGGAVLMLMSLAAGETAAVTHHWPFRSEQLQS